MTYRMPQEDFWAGDFGTEYIERNQGEKLFASNLNFFGKALRSTRRMRTCIEFGANIGMNLKAVQLLYPEIDRLSRACGSPVQARFRRRDSGTTCAVAAAGLWFCLSSRPELSSERYHLVPDGKDAVLTR